MYEDLSVKTAMEKSSVKPLSSSTVKKDFSYVGKAVVLSLGPSQITGTVSGVSAAIRIVKAFGKVVGARL